jgi:hypothetical protein
MCEEKLIEGHIPGFEAPVELELEIEAFNFSIDPEG